VQLRPWPVLALSLLLGGPASGQGAELAQRTGAVRLDGADGRIGAHWPLQEGVDALFSVEGGDGRLPGPGLVLAARPRDPARATLRGLVLRPPFELAVELRTTDGGAGLELADPSDGSRRVLVLLRADLFGDGKRADGAIRLADGEAELLGLAYRSRLRTSRWSRLRVQAGRHDLLVELDGRSFRVPLAEPLEAATCALLAREGCVEFRGLGLDSSLEAGSFARFERAVAGSSLAANPAAPALEILFDAVLAELGGEWRWSAGKAELAALGPPERQRLERALAAAGQGELAAARRELRSLRPAAPGPAAYWLGRVALALGQEDEAGEEFWCAAAAPGAGAAALRELGLLALSRGDLPRALAVLQEAIGRDPEDPWTRLLRARTRSLLGDAAGAAEDAAEAACARPESPALAALRDRMARGLPPLPWPGASCAGDARVVLETELPLGTAEELAAMLSDHVARLRARFPLPGTEHGPCRVLLFADAEGLRRYLAAAGEPAPPGPGLFHRRERRVLAGALPGSEETRALLRHEATHDHFHRLQPAQPPWLAEGLAEAAAYGLAEPEGPLAAPGAGHLRALRAAGGALPAAVLLGLDAQAFAGGAAAAWHYASAWALVHLGLARPRSAAGRLLADALASGPVPHRAELEAVERELQAVVASWIGSAPR
jgi:hypothetical protein